MRFVLKRVKDQNIIYYPGMYVDSEKYKEFLVRVQELRKKIRLRLRLRRGI